MRHLFQWLTFGLAFFSFFTLDRIRASPTLHQTSLLMQQIEVQIWYPSPPPESIHTTIYKGPHRTYVGTKAKVPPRVEGLGVRLTLTPIRAYGDLNPTKSEFPPLNQPLVCTFTRPFTVFKLRGGKKINIALSPLMKPRENQKYNQIQPHPTLLSNLTVVLRTTKIYIVSLIRPHGNSLE